MNHGKILTATLFFYFLIHQSCSQSSGKPGISNKTSFEATTPCDEESKRLLGIPSGAKCGMIKWNLALARDDKNLPTTFDLSYTYGSPKQGTRGFEEGAITTTLKGRWTTGKAKLFDSDRAIITLTPVNSPVRLTFLQPGEGLLHLLKKDGTPMVGDAAWSYTLNAINPQTVSPANFLGKELSSTGIRSVTDTAAVFVGRTPCNESLRKLNSISADGCNLIKCKLILLQDSKTLSPGNFIIQTIYVGKGDTRYSVTGKWKLTQGVANDPKAVVYHLMPDGAEADDELLLLKVGDDILFFINKGARLLVGNDYCSYTLNRAN